jgi:hypothetical protein
VRRIEADDQRFFFDGLGKRPADRGSRTSRCSKNASTESNALSLGSDKIFFTSICDLASITRRRISRYRDSEIVSGIVISYMIERP